MPVFSIHGNHDDPTGANHISALDSLSSAGLINYFGKYTNFDEIVLSPILLQKSNCKIALYGLGSVNEERLFRIVTEGKLSYCLPEAEEDWFKIVVVHQNRIKHSNTKYLPEKFLSTVPDFVVWGHEHESRPEPDWNESEEFFVYQPGSTVATSLCEAEAVPKHCSILEVQYNEMTQKSEFRINTIPLKTVRPFIWETIDIPNLIGRGSLAPDEDSIRDFCRQRVEQMIQKARLDHSGDERQPKQPLIRLRLEYSDESQQFHSAQFGSQFNGRVANHSDIIHYVKRKENHNYEEEGAIDFDEMRGLLDGEIIDQRVNITDIITEYFDKIKDPKLKLDLLSEKALTLGVIELVEKESNDAISDVFEAQKEKMKDCLLALDDLKIGTIAEMKEQIRKIKNHNSKDDDSQDLSRILAESRNRMMNRGVKPSNDSNPVNDSDSDSDFGSLMASAIPSNGEQHNTSGRGKGRGRGRGRGKGVTVKRESDSKPRISTQTTLDIISDPTTSGTRRSSRNPTPAKITKYEDFVEISDSD